jgi:hypothetical protein
VADVPGVLVDAADAAGDRPERWTASTVAGGPCCSAPAGTPLGDRALRRADHPYLAAATACRLVAAGAAVVGIDSLNVDGTRNGERPVHTILLEAGIPIIEHMCSLADVGDRPFRFFAVPPAITGMGTFPVRPSRSSGEAPGRPRSPAAFVVNGLGGPSFQPRLPSARPPRAVGRGPGPRPRGVCRRRPGRQPRGGAADREAGQPRS